MPLRPLKGEDEEDNSTPETVEKPSESQSVCISSSTSSSSSSSSSSCTSSTCSSLARSKALVNPERSPSVPTTSPPSSGCESPVPRLRLNTSLATDPALRSDVMTVKTEKTSPDSEVVVTIGNPPSAAELDYLSSVPSAFQHVLANAGRLFPSPQFPEKDALNLPKSRKQESPAVIIEGRAVFLCTPCGIRFSSASTLEAHQTYYCSHRVQLKGRGDSDGDDPKSPQNNGNEDGESSGKVLRTGKQYGCPHCSYSADKKVSLNRHMRMHSSSPAAQIPIPIPVPVILPSTLQNGAPELPPANSSQLVDRYCQDCDIRFYSVKTLKAHKMHYCSSRYAKGSPTGKNSSTPASPTESQRISPEPSSNQSRQRRSEEGQQQQQQQQQQPFLLLRTDPVLIVPYSLLQSASVFTGISPNFPSQDSPCILMPNGTVQPMSNLVSRLSNDKDLAKNSNYSGKERSKMREESPPPPAKSSRAKLDVASAAAPLDLSVRRSSDKGELLIDMEDEKENVFRASPHEEGGASSPSLASYHGSVASSAEKRSEERKRSECHSEGSSPSLSLSPNSKRSPRRTPNGIGTIRPKEMKKSSDAGCCLAIEQSARRNSVGGKLAGPLPLMSSPQLPLLLPGATPELLGQASLLPLLSTDLRLPGLMGGQTVADTASVPQVLVKQGVSKCQECNIVFCKHENYIAHKKHYCSARLPDLSSDESSRTSPITSKSPGNGNLIKESSAENSKTRSSSPSPTGKVPPPLQYQFICVACSISFTSLDNLTTHQTYYCTKRSSDGVKPTDEKSRKCGKCKAVANGDHQCIGPCPSSVVTGWKCPCCDVVSPTAAAAQKHMDTHQGVRAFRCTICKYKGNTLRGMRTHIRMHFDKKSNDFQEEKFISCILDEESEQQQQQRQPSPQQQQQPQNNGFADSSQVVVKVEAGAEDDEFVEVDVVETPFHHQVQPEEGVQPEDGREKSPGSGNNNSRGKINYCESCDISFNYLSSLIAHKKFYCSATATGESEVGQQQQQQQSKNLSRTMTTTMTTTNSETSVLQ